MHGGFNVSFTWRCKETTVGTGRCLFRNADTCAYNTMLCFKCNKKSLGRQEISSVFLFVSFASRSTVIFATKSMRYVQHKVRGSGTDGGNNGGEINRDDIYVLLRGQLVQVLLVP